MSKISIPDPLRPIAPYILRSIELASRNVVVSYYCLQYAVEEGVSMLKQMSDPDRNTCTQFLLAKMDDLEQAKKELELNDEEGRAIIELYALKMFKRADDADRAGRHDAVVAKLFYTASLLMEVTKQFGDLTEDILEKQKYARWRATEINRAVKTGTSVTPPTEADNAEDDDHAGGMSEQSISSSNYTASSTLGSSSGSSRENNGGRSRSGSTSNDGSSWNVHSSQKPSSHGSSSSSSGAFHGQQSTQPHASNRQQTAASNTLRTNKPMASATTSSSSSSSGNARMTGSSGGGGAGDNVSLDDVMLAQKYAKFAVSSLQFNDIPAARKYLQDALNLL